MASVRKLKNKMYRYYQTNREDRNGAYVLHVNKTTGQKYLVKIICYHRDKEIITNDDGTTSLRCNMCGRIKPYNMGDPYKMKPMYADSKDYIGQETFEWHEWHLDLPVIIPITDEQAKQYEEESQGKYDFAFFRRNYNKMFRKPSKKKLYGKHWREKEEAKKKARENKEKDK